MNQVFLLGAGFTRAVIGQKAPLTNEIMPKLDISQFPEIADDFERTFPDIEQFISRLDLRCFHYEKTNKSLADRLNDIRANIVQQIVKLFEPNQLYIDKSDIPHELTRFVEIIPDQSLVITLNYDCVLDQGLYYSDRWSPFGGYGYPTFPHTGDDNAEKGRILLLKLHGSCNFRNRTGNTDYFNIEITDSIFPEIHASLCPSNSTLDKGPHLLVMSYVKQYHNGIMSLWRKAISTLREADKLFIVGCSLRDEDTFLRFALYHFGTKPCAQTFSVEIIDQSKETCDNIKNKILKLVGNPDKQDIKPYDKGLKKYLATL